MTLASENVDGGLEKAGVVTERASATTESSFSFGSLSNLDGAHYTRDFMARLENEAVGCRERAGSWDQAELLFAGVRALVLDPRS